MKVLLGDVCKVVNGFAFDGGLFVSKGGFPIIRIRDLKTNNPSIGFSGKFDEEFIVKPGSLLVGMDGEFRCYEWQGPPALLNQRVCELVPNTSRLERDFLKLWIGKELAQIEDTTAFTTVKHLSSKDIQALPIYLPPLVEQRSLAGRLNSQLGEISLAQRAIEEQLQNAEILSSRILSEAFSGNCPITVRPSINGALTDWRWLHLINVAQLESGHTPSRRHPEWWGGHVPWLSLTDIRKLHGKYAHETGEYTNDAGLANSSARLLPSGTVCVSRTASIGFVTVLGTRMATSQDFCNWVCDPNKLNPEFLMYAFMAAQGYLRDLGSGAVHKTIYMPTVKSFHLYAPDVAAQERIARMLRERLDAAEALTEGLKMRLADIEHLPQRAMAAAFS